MGVARLFLRRSRRRLFRAEEPSATRHQNQVLELERTGTDGLSNPAALTLVKEVETSELATLLSFDRGKRNRPTLAGGPGSTNEHVAEAEGFEPFCAPLADALLKP